VYVWVCMRECVCVCVRACVRACISLGACLQSESLGIIDGCSFAQDVV